MGRTIQSATQTWIEEEKALTRFSRALRKEDQLIMKELIDLSRLHIAEASYAGNLYPMDAYLISMLLELAKKIGHMETKMNELCRKNGVADLPDPELPQMPDILSLICGEEEPNDEWDDD